MNHDRKIYRKQHRIRTSQEFSDVFNHKIRKSRGPITIFIKPNNLPHHRLGLSIGRKVGNAVTRARVKRMIRESFRHARPTIPPYSGATPSSAGFDIVVTARKHDQAPIDQWFEWFNSALTSAIKVAEKKAHTSSPNSPSPKILSSEQSNDVAP